MKDLKIFPKMFIQMFSIIGIIVLIIHLLVFLIFPKTYLDTRKEEIYSKANEISKNMSGKELRYIEETLDFYSKNNEIKAFVKGSNKSNEIKIRNNVDVNLDSNNNSLIIEERKITLNNGKKIHIQFVSTADMQRDARNLSLKFLPYSLAISLLISAIISLIYAKLIKNNVNEIKNVTDNMMRLDKNAYLHNDSKDEVGQLKEQINNLYFTLLKAIDDLEVKNKEILKLENLKYDFFKGASHELKTPLASLKIILENMKYNIGKYKDRDIYINKCIDIVDALTRNISQILSVYSIENLKNDEEILKVKDILEEVIEKYELLANQKNIRIENHIIDEKIYIGKTAFNIILSNLISNCIKYSIIDGIANIYANNDWLYIENMYIENTINDIENQDQDKFGFNNENSNGLGLYIVENLLNKYNIKYKILKNEGKFSFQIKLFS